jgi:hypothetical protein
MRRGQADHHPRTVRVAMVVLPSKAMVSRRVGMDSLLQVKDNMDNLPQVKDNTDNLPQVRDRMDTLLPATDNMDSSRVDMAAQGSSSSSKVAMVDHHQANLLTVDRRAAMGLLRLHRGTRLNLRSVTPQVATTGVNTAKEETEKKNWKRAVLGRLFMDGYPEDSSPGPNLL